MNKQIIIDYEEYLTLEHINKIHMNEMNKLRNCVVIPEEEYEKYKQLEQENKELKEQCEKQRYAITENLNLHNKIDTVIEIIECSRWDYDMYDISADGINHILKILKDSDVDE